MRSALRNIYGIVFLLPVIFPYSYVVQFYGFNLLDIFLLLAITVGLVFELLGKPVNFIKDRTVGVLILALALLIIGIGIGVYLSDDRTSALGFVKSYFILPVTYGYAAFKLSFTKQRLQEMLFAFVLGAAVFSALSLVLSPIFNNFFTEGRFRSFFDSPNYLAFYILPAFSLALIYSVFNPSKYTYPVAGFLLLVLTLTLSRSALASAFILILVALGLFFAKYRNYRSIILGAGLLFISASGGLLYYLTSERQDSSNSIRTEIWSKSMEMVTDNPVLGVGIGEFQDTFAEKYSGIVNFPEFVIPNALHAHNVALKTYLEYSVFGFAAFLLLISALVYVFFKFIRNNNINGDRVEGQLFIAVFATISAILITSLLDNNILKNDTTTIFFMLVFLGLTFKNYRARMIDE